MLERSRTLAKLALAGAVVLVLLVLSLPFAMNPATVSAGFLLLWGLFILLTAIILGVAFAYLFLLRGLKEAGAAAAGGRPLPVAEREAPASASGSYPEGVPELALRLLAGDERRLYRRIVEAGGTILQKDLVGAGPFSGSQVTRLLDRLEAKGLVSRERHGMTNRITLSDAAREKD